MGFHYGIARFRNASADSGPVLTPHEFSAAFGRAMRSVLRCDACHGTVQDAPQGPRPRPGDVCIPPLVVRVRDAPNDPTAHRLLGTALLGTGSTGPGVRHLGVALRLLLAEVGAPASLHGSLCARLEIALALFPLISLAPRWGRVALVRRMLGLVP